MTNYKQNACQRYGNGDKAPICQFVFNFIKCFALIFKRLSISAIPDNKKNCAEEVPQRSLKSYKICFLEQFCRIFTSVYQRLYFVNYSLTVGSISHTKPF